MNDPLALSGRELVALFAKRALSPVELGRMREHFTTTSRYEWMFFDAAYRREDWPV